MNRNDKKEGTNNNISLSPRLIEIECCGTLFLFLINSGVLTDKQDLLRCHSDLDFLLLAIIKVLIQTQSAPKNYQYKYAFGGLVVRDIRFGSCIIEILAKKYYRTKLIEKLFQIFGSCESFDLELQLTDGTAIYSCYAFEERSSVFEKRLRGGKYFFIVKTKKPFELTT